MKILVKNCAIIPMTDENIFVSNASIGIEKGKISFIGEVPPDFIPDRILNGYNKLVLPGLINSHTHIPMSLLRNYADDLALEDWLFKKVMPIEDKFTENDVYWGSMLSIAEMILSGTTCFNDMYYMMDEEAEAVQIAGIRAVLGIGIGSSAISKNKFEKSIQFYKDWHNKAEGRITITIDPHAIYTCSRDSLIESMRIAESLKVPLHIHLSESKKEVNDSIKKYGETPIKYLYDLGFFEIPTLAAHCVYVTDQDIDILVNNKVTVLHNPSSNLKLANGIAPIQKMLDAGINVALGTDGAASNNNQNMFEEIHLAALLGKVSPLDAEAISSYDALHMATRNGARALNLLGSIGTIEIGKKADLIIVNVDKPHFYPHHNLVSAMVYSAQAADVESVIVDGNILMERRELKTIDIKEVYYEIDKIKEKLF
ncbi:MAG: amidohydrolase [Candidatus Cloacimonetes bacterium]|nr:amidohydrolase [Candidatus Cloacimonadota bacterium]